jgi:hypothetical protein
VLRIGAGPQATAARQSQRQRALRHLEKCSRSATIRAHVGPQDSRGVRRANDIRCPTGPRYFPLEAARHVAATFTPATDMYVHDSSDLFQQTPPAGVSAALHPSERRQTDTGFIYPRPPIWSQRTVRIEVSCFSSRICTPPWTGFQRSRGGHGGPYERFCAIGMPRSGSASPGGISRHFNEGGARDFLP